MADLSTWWSAWRDPLAAPELLPLIEAVGRVLLGKEQQVRLAFSCLLPEVQPLPTDAYWRVLVHE